MTREQAIEVLNMVEAHGHIVIEAKAMAIEALKAEPCSDCISRQAVKELYYKDGYIDFRKICELPSVTPCPCEDCISRQAAIDDIWDGTNMDIYTREVKEHLEALPPVTPAPKMGRWIKIKPYPLQMLDYECSECGHGTDDCTENYCAECGCRMTEVDDEA